MLGWRVAPHRCHSEIAILRTEPGGKCGVGQLVMTRPWPSGAYAMNGNARYFVAARQVEFAGTTLNLVRSTGDQRAEGRLSEMPKRVMSDELGGLDATENAGIGTVLNRCRALAAKIANELRNKRPEHFVDKLSLADVHASLERAADVLSTVKGSQARGRQRHR